MKRKRHSPEQVIQKLRDADAMLAAGKSMGQVCQALEISEQTFHRGCNQGVVWKIEVAKSQRRLMARNPREDWGRGSTCDASVEALIKGIDPGSKEFNLECNLT